MHATDGRSLRRANGAAGKLFGDIANRTSQAAGRADIHDSHRHRDYLGNHRPFVSLLRYMAVGDQYRHDDRDVSDGLPHPEFAEPGQRGHPGETRRTHQGE